MGERAGWLHLRRGSSHPNVPSFCSPEGPPGRVGTASVAELIWGLGREKGRDAESGLRGVAASEKEALI